MAVKEFDEEAPTVRITKPTPEEKAWSGVMARQRTRSREIDAVPRFVEPEQARVTVSRTKSDDMTTKMHSIDHRMARIDGPPQDPYCFESDDTDVDVMVVDLP